MPAFISTFQRSTLLAVALACIAWSLAGCTRQAPAEDPIRAVKVITVESASLQSGREFAGEVRPRVESSLGFRVGGKLVERKVELGQRVKAGQVLAQLDPQDYRLVADASRAQVAAALTARDLAAADFNRYRELREKGFISGAELERRESSLKSAQAQLDQAQAQAVTQGNQTAYTTLVADVAGVVTAVLAQPGQVVAAGAPVLRVAQDGPRDVVFAVPEDKVAAIRLGSAVAVQAWAQNAVLQGKVREVAASADPVTRTFEVRVALESEQAPALGSTVTARPEALAAAAAPVIKLPTSALRQEGGASAVWVLEPESMTLRSQRVEIKQADGNEVVIANGLAPGMRVVSAGVHVLSPGQKVSIYQAKPAPAASASALPAASAPNVPAVPADTAKQ